MGDVEENGCIVAEAFAESTYADIEGYDEVSDAESHSNRLYVSLDVHEAWQSNFVPPLEDPRSTTPQMPVKLAIVDTIFRHGAHHTGSYSITVVFFQWAIVGIATPFPQQEIHKRL